MSRSRGAARALADPAAGSIVATVEIAVSPERLFAALSTPEVIEWWGSAETYQVRRWQMDLRVGGKWRSEGVSADGRPFTVQGEVLELDPPWLLTHTWSDDWDGGGHTDAATLARVKRWALPPASTGLWWGEWLGPESNREPADYETAALTS